MEELGLALLQNESNPINHHYDASLDLVDDDSDLDDDEIIVGSQCEPTNVRIYGALASLHDSLTFVEAVRA